MFYKYFIAVFALLVVSSLVFPSQAYAYLDPGSASLFFQMLIAGLLGALFSIKLFWRKIPDFFSKLFLRDKKNEKK